MLFELSDMMSNAENPERIILDRHQMKNGLYVRIDREGNIKDNLIVNKETSTIGNTYWWFRDRDYYSNIINTQKAVCLPEGKSIESNNMYTFFTRYSKLPEVGDNKCFEYPLLEKYYAKISRDYDNDSNKKKLLKKAQIKDIDINDLELCKSIMIKALNETMEFIKNLDKNSGFTAKKDYVKLFIESDIDEEKDIINYIRESKRYLAPRIFNKNDYNIEYKNTIYGCSNENMGLNSNKPYLKLKSTKFEVPFRVSFEQTIENYRIMQWIKNAIADDGNKIEDFSLGWNYNINNNPAHKTNNKGLMGQHFKLKRNKNINYEDYVIVENDIVSHDIEDLKEYFEFKNYLRNEYCKIEDCKKRDELGSCINDVFFKSLYDDNYDYDIEGKSIKLNSFCKNAIEIMKIPMKNYFRLGIEGSLNLVIDKITLGIIISNIKDKDIEIQDIICQENLRLNLLRYFKIGGKENMGEFLTEVIKGVKTKVKSKEFIPIDSDDEFYYCIGQLAYYLYNQSEAKQKNQNMYNNIINMQNSERIKELLKILYKTYNYKIGNNDLRFNRLFSMVMGYKTKKRANVDMIICGLLTYNAIYTKKEDE